MIFQPVRNMYAIPIRHKFYKIASVENTLAYQSQSIIAISIYLLHLKLVALWEANVKKSISVYLIGNIF